MVRLKNYQYRQQMASTGCCSGSNGAAGGGGGAAGGAAGGASGGTSGDARGSGDVEIGVAVAESKNVAESKQHHQKKSSNNPFGRG